MKRIFLSVLLVFGVGQLVVAAPNGPWINHDVITTPPDINAPSFYNNGWINFVTYSAGFKATPFETHNTLSYLNEGTMICSDGFRFDTLTSNGRQAAVCFVNTETISALDGPSVFPFTTVVPGYYVPAAVTATPSYLVVSAGAITNRGTLSVGGVGLLSLSGNNVDLAQGIQLAGQASDDLLGETGGTAYRGLVSLLNNFYVNPIGVRDLFWGAGVQNFALASLVSANPLGGYTVRTPAVDTTERHFTPTFKLSLPMSGFYFAGTNLYSPQFAGYVYTNYDNRGSNIYMNVVLVNTNFIDTNIVMDVRFTPFAMNTRTGWRNDGAMQAVVQFGVPTMDVATGSVVTNAFYLLDKGALIPAAGNLRNYESPNGYSRPESFEITTGTPTEWFGSSPTNIPFDPIMIAPGQTYTVKNVDAQYAMYGAQVGSNPESQSGFMGSSTNGSFSFASSLYPMYKDPTNEPGRVEICAGNLDLTAASIRSEGMVKLTATQNVKGLDQVYIDSGVISCDLKVPTGSLILSNVIPSHFRRCRGDVYAWSANWTCVQTNDFGTNTYLVHVLVVDHNLKADFTPSTPSVALRAPRVEVQDPLNMYHKCLFQTENLILNSQVALSGDLTSLTVANLPKLKTFLNDTNGYLTAMSQINFGMDTTAGLTAFTNRGVIAATVPSVKSSYLENSGIIEATTGGNMFLQANTMVLKSNTSSFYSSGNVLYSSHALQLTAATLSANDSWILAGASGRGALTLNVSKELNDGVPGVAGTNLVLNNYWYLYNGLVMQKKPALGDLFGTEIICQSSGISYNTHIWPGIDCGATVDGFKNNLVIGRLVLDKQTPNSTLFFTGAGTKNAIYVDYLELRDLATNYWDNFAKIDRNLMIYFADCNIAPDKIVLYHGDHFAWVPEFAGPNSSASVAAHVNGVVTNLFVNEFLANNANLDSDGDGLANKNDPFPFDGLILGVNINGQGTVTPDLNMKLLVLGKSYTFKATPALGYLFAGWTGGTNTRSSTITVTMTRDLVLNASFIPDNLYNAKGTYSGLFNTWNNSMQSCGSFTFVLNEKGTGTGKLITPLATNAFIPFFAQNGSGTAIIKRSATETLVLHMQLDVSNSTEQVVGTITDCITGGSDWTADLMGNRSVYDAMTNPAPAAGRYTIALPGGPDAAITPGGDGYASIVVSNSGVALMSGRLADNLPFTLTATVSKDGSMPFFLASGGKEMIFGWLAFDTNDFSAISGNLVWVKKAGCGTYYKNAFTTDINVLGSCYVAPAAGQGVLNIVNPKFTADGGNLAGPLAWLPNYNFTTYTYSTNNMSMTVDPAKGCFSGKFVNAAGKTLLMNGVVLQKQNEARGFFLGTTQSGNALLSESISE